MPRPTVLTIAILAVLLGGLAACTADDDGSGGATADPSATALETVDESVPPDPDAPEQSATEQSDLAVVLGELPLPPASAPLGEATSEGDTVTQTFTVQGIQSADEVLDDDYLDTLEDAGWDEDEPVEERGDGVSTTLRRGEVEMLLVAQDGPADDPENAVLNIVLMGDPEA